ncbi:hypothetical protein A3770_03p19870 [Chloropicon primus]|uniref:Uncharacterized protein n=1 Tax=Chloropicon primus TaxID=1764295 RepID=A0A5B8MGC3_9CHLO|nr:hypothetical protein A3770_03p19870 [Chloropicon primus]|eukprot:QDZ19469.1 hypothetical protein A3770_03p19870 [Chloropicon primus]
MEGGERGGAGCATTSGKGNLLQDVDGCCRELYGLLRERNVLGESCPGVHLQDTVVFGAEGEVEAWYFTSAKKKRRQGGAVGDQGGQLLKKHSRHCTGQRILEEWSKDVRKGSRSPTDCAAYLLYPDSSGLPGPHLDQETGTNLEFLDWFQAEAFLHKGEFPKYGVLQRAAGGSREREARNSVICVTWSPKLCLVERRTNCNRVDDTQVPLHERMITFEGRESFRLSTSAPLSGTKVAELVQGACKSIVDHVGAVTRREQNIVRLVAYFKVESSLRVSLLWCSSLRLLHRVPGSPGLFASLRVNLDPNIRVKRGTIASRRQGRRVWRIGDFECPSCSKVFEKRERCEVMYKTIIAHHEKESGGQANESRTVPDVLARTEGPSLNAKKFADVASNPAFLYKTCYMCVDCCLDYTSTALEDLSAANPASMMVGMTGEFSGPELQSYNILNLMMEEEGLLGEHQGEGEADKAKACRGRPLSASQAQSKSKGGDKGKKVLRSRPNSAAIRRLSQPKTNREALGSRGTARENNLIVGAEPKAGKIAWDSGQGGKVAFSYDNFLEELGAEEERGSETLDPASSDIPMDRFMKINNLTEEELEYLKTVLD